MTVEETTAYLDSQHWLDGYYWQSGDLHVEIPDGHSHAGSALIGTLRRRFDMRVRDVNFRDREVSFYYA